MYITWRNPHWRPWGEGSSVMAPLMDLSLSPSSPEATGVPSILFLHGPCLHPLHNPTSGQWPLLLHCLPSRHLPSLVFVFDRSSCPILLTGNLKLQTVPCSLNMCNQLIFSVPWKLLGKYSLYLPHSAASFAKKVTSTWFAGSYLELKPHLKP